MKILSFLMMTLFMGNSCIAQKNADMSSVELIYSAMSRGYYQKIVVENQTVSVIKNKGEEAVTNKIDGVHWAEIVTVTKSKSEEAVTNKIDGVHWAEIVTEFKKINLETISQLKAPTEKRFYDGAATANLKIIKNGKTYETKGFDNGFPPAEIEKLVTLLVAFTQK